MWVNNWSTMNVRVHCKGCDKSFPAFKRVRALISGPLLVHCVEECEEFKKLGRLISCVTFM